MPTSYRNPYENTVYQTVVEKERNDLSQQKQDQSQSFRNGPTNGAYSKAANNFYFDNSFEPCK